MAVIGIDLGTSTCEIAVYKNGRAEIIPNNIGERITPSYVGINTYGETIVGKDAKDQYVGRPDYTVMEVKRLMGSGQIVHMGKIEYTPEEISAEILKYLKKCAEDYLCETIEEAVITVPANFNNEQREATMNAARLSGLKVERIINEPTSAALSFGIKNMSKEKNILVYDFGGGTLDVTILEMYDGIIDVKSSYGCTHLGGKDIDDRLSGYIIDKLDKELDINSKHDINILSKIKQSAEETKIKLSFNKSANICIENIYANNHIQNFNMKIMRSEFENLITDLVESSGEIIDKALSDGGIEIGNIDTVLMVGGTTRIPLVRKFVQEKLNKKIRTEVNPDEAVALGAAIQAAIKEGDINEDKGLIVTDVCPFNLGIAITSNINGQEYDGAFSKIINRNSTIPVTRSDIYNTCNDNQISAKVQIYQTLDNYCIWVKDAENIGNFEITGIPEAPAGEQKIIVEFSYDINGNVRVVATISSTGESNEIEIKGKGLSIDEVAAIASNNDDNWREFPLGEKYKITIENAEKKLKEINDINTKKELLNLLNIIKRHIADNDEDAADIIDGKIIDLLFEIE